MAKSLWRKSIHLFPVLALLLLSGCASSERMTRMSGGVIDEYSAPKSHRMRSEKYQAKTKTFSPASRSAGAGLGLEHKLINIWPFFFRSGDYLSILWPMVDYDKFGMAIRPFYNHEGDDYSILFPLTSWNTADRSGWILNSTWSPHSFNFFPLAHHSFNAKHGSFWYTPLLIHSWEYRSPGLFNYRKSKYFTEVLLGYYGKEIRVDAGDRNWLFRHTGGKEFPDGYKRELAYRLGRENRPVPQTAAELYALQREEFAKFTETISTNWGFFPLFHVTKSKDSRSFNLIGPVFAWEKSSRKTFSGVLGILGGMYTRRELDPAGYGRGCGENGERSFKSWALLTRFYKDAYYRDTPELETLRNLYRLSYRDPFERYRQEILAELAELDPELKLPETVADGNTLRLFLADLVSERKLGEKAPVDYNCGGGFVPLFLYGKKGDSSWWFSLAALTGASRSEKSSAFWSVPLLSCFSKSERESFATVATPLAWYSKTRRVERFNKTIYARSEMWAPERSMVEFEDDYALLGMYFHGKSAFYVTRENVDAEAAEGARKLLLELTGRWDGYRGSVAMLEKRVERNRAWKTKDKIEHYRKLIEDEEIRIRREALDRRLAEIREDEEKLAKYCAALGFPFRREVLEERDTARSEVEKLFDHCAELRWVEDFGNGILFRKQKRENGDYDWRVLFGLAGGEKRGEREDTHVLSFLYRYRQEGEKSEKLVFPFVAVQKDGGDSRVSFLWRVWERVEKGDKAGGHVLFVPYGNLK